MERLLRSAINRGTGQAAMLNAPNFGKTGTSQDNRDALFVGYAGDLVVGVWVGNDDNSPLGGVHGGGIPARIWRDFMRQALGERIGPTRPKPRPDPSGPVQPLDVPDLRDLPIGDTRLRVDPNGAVISTEIDGNPVDVRIDGNGVRIEPSATPAGPGRNFPSPAGRSVDEQLPPLDGGGISGLSGSPISWSWVGVLSRSDAASPPSKFH